MSEQYEPSYYEIALTGRQVLVAFVILLVCLVAAFFSGVWVGRGGPAGARQAQTQVGGQVGGQAQAQSRAQAGTAGPDTGLAATESLSPSPGESPDRSPESEPSAGSGATASGEATGKEDGADALSFFDEEAKRGETAPAEKGDTGRGSTPAAAPSAAPERERPPAEEPGTTPERPRETVNPSGTLAGGDVVIQVFSSSDKDKAQEILDRLKANDFRAFISPVTDDGRTLYRVRVGPFEHQEDAERVAAELRRRLDLDTWITR